MSYATHSYVDEALFLHFQVASTNTNNAQISNAANNSKRNLKALKNLSVIMVLFILSWVPFLSYCVACVRDPPFCLENQTVKIIYVGILLLFRINSIVNPIVYAVRFRGFNVAFRLMFGCIKEDERHTLMESVTSMWLGLCLVSICKKNIKVIIDNMRQL